jgi:hypothetical protein
MMAQIYLEELPYDLKHWQVIWLPIPGNNISCQNYHAPLSCSLIETQESTWFLICGFCRKYSTVQSYITYKHK